MAGSVADLNTRMLLAAMEGFVDELRKLVELAERMFKPRLRMDSPYFTGLL